MALSIVKCQILTPQGAKIPEPILMKLGVVNYVRDFTPHDNFGAGIVGSVGKQVTSHICEFHFISFFLFFFFFLSFFYFFTALHAMQTRSSDENSVRLSVCPSVCPSVCLSHACIVTKR